MALSTGAVVTTDQEGRNAIANAISKISSKRLAKIKLLQAGGNHKEVDLNVDQIVMMEPGESEP